MTWEYLAGFFDGEGCIHVSTVGKGGTPQMIVSVAQANLPILHMVKNLAGCGTIRENYTLKNNWDWRVHSKQDIKSFLEKLLPYLILKKSEAALAIALCDITPAPGKPFTDTQALKTFKLADKMREVQSARKGDGTVIQ